MTFISSYSSADWVNPDSNFGLGHCGGYGGLNGRPIVTPHLSTPLSTMSFSSGTGYGGGGYGLYGNSFASPIWAFGAGVPFLPLI